MRNIRLVLAYDGTDFHGWQRQPNALSIQGVVEAAIERITQEPAALCSSGRTDAGVHALNQVANFKTSSRIPCQGLLRALNGLLPSTVRVREAEEVFASFHARYDVRSKTYRYRILQTPICSPFLSRFVYHFPYSLNRDLMAEAAELLEGKHDFTSFAGADAPANDMTRPDRSRSMVRTIFSSEITWRSRTSMLLYEARGSGFLHHMVRTVVGTLLEVGKGKLTPNDVSRILKARDRTQAGPTAPARGLCLIKVEY